MTVPTGAQENQPLSIIGQVRTLASASGLYVLGDVLVRALQVLLIPLYTRHLSPADYGVLAVTSTVTILLTIVLGLALQGAVSRLHFEAEDEAARRTLYGTVLAFLLVVPAILVALIELAGRAGMLDIFPSVPFDPYLRYAVLTAYLAMFIEVPIAIYAARQQARRVVALTLTNAVSLGLLTVLFVVVWDRGVIGALQAALIAAGIVAATSIFLTARMSSRPLSRPAIGAALLFGLPLLPHALGQWVLQLSDRLVLDHVVSTTELGLYSLGATVGGAASLFVTASARAFTPHLTSRMKGAADTQAQVPVLGTYWVVGITATCAVFAAASPNLLRLITTPAYDGATEVIPWIVAGYVAYGLYNVVTQGTWFAMRMRWVPVLTLVAGVANVALVLLLAPRYGGVGAAAGTAMAFVLLAILQGMLSHRLHPIAWEYLRWAKTFVAGAGAFAAAVPVGDSGTVVAVVAKAGIATCAFVLILFVLRFFTAPERVRMRALLAGHSASG